MPNSTMNKITEMELSALRSNASFATAMSPLAVVPTRATVTMGRAHAMTLRKISASRTTMSNRVTMLTTTSACSDDSWESSDWAAGPVTPERRSVPSTSGSRSARRFRASSMAAGSKAFLPGLTCTKIACTKPLSEAGAAAAVPRLS